MGNRALVIFKDKANVSPTVYLYWNGGEVPEYIAALKTMMAARPNDAEYAAARFIGIVHSDIAPPYSLGVMNTSPKLQQMILRGGKAMEKALDEESHGDAGVVLVDTADFSWRAFGGYLEETAAVIPLKTKGA